MLSQWNDTPKSKSSAAPSAKSLTKTPRARAAAARAAARRGSEKVLEEQHSQAAFFGGSDDDDDDADANAAAYDVDNGDGDGGGDGDGLFAAVKNMNRNLDAALSPQARRRQQCETLESESPQKPARAAATKATNATNATKAAATKRPPVVRRVSRQPSRRQGPGRQGPGRQGPGRGSMMNTLAMDMAERRLRIEGEDGGNGDDDFSDESSDSGGWFEET